MPAALGLLLGAGVLTLWVRELWAQAAVQAGLLGCAAVWCVRAFRHGTRPMFHPMLLPLGGAALWGGLQACLGLTVSPWLTLNAARDWLVVAAAAFLTLQAFDHPDAGRRARTVFLWFSAAVAAQALLQLFTSGGRVFWLFDSGYADGVLGPFVYRNKFAQFIELAYPIAVWRALSDRRKAPLWITMAAVMFASVVAGASRSGFLFLALETALVPWLAWRKGRIGTRRAAQVGAWLAASVVIGGAVAGWSGLGQRLFGMDPLADHRVPILASTLEMIRARPWTGWGLGTWAKVYPEFARFDLGLFVNQAHNDWLQWAAEGGVPMLLLMLWWAATLLRPALATVWGVGAPVVLLHGLVDYPMQQLPVFSCLVAGCGTLAAAEAGSFRWGEEFRYKVRVYATSVSMSRTALTILLAALSLTLNLARSQSRPGAQAGTMAEAGMANLPGQKIGANDLIAISVYDAPEFTRTVRVAADGTLRLPMVEPRIKAAGMQPTELETAIAELLVKEGLFVKPVVIVTVAEYASRPISVVGAVRKPLTFQAVGRVTLLEALARAEGVGPEAGGEIIITQLPAAEGGERLLRRIPLRDLLEKSRADLNIELTGGEEIRVPEARKIYVTGNVKKPGAFPVRDGTEITVMKALALSEGLAPFPQKLAYIYRPDESPAGRREIPVELSKIVARKSPDIPLEAGDVLYVPEDRGKRNTALVLERATGFAAATASGILVWRR
jgi:polysaccharide biosynthesis/export protein